MDTVDTEQTGLLKSAHKMPTSEKEEEVKDKKEGESPKYVFNLIIGCLMLVVLICSYVVSTSTAQVIGRKTSMFMLNLYRYGFLAVMAIVWSALLKFSVSVEKKDAYKFVVAIFFNYAKSTLFYIAAAYIPVGNLGGVFIGLHIIFSMGVEFMWREISKLSIFILGLSLIGVTSLLQLWQLQDQPIWHQRETPCDYLDNRTDTYGNGTRYSNSNDTTWDGALENHWIHPVLLGYIYIVFAAISATISGTLSRSIMESYNVYCYFFWGSVFQTLFSGLMVILLKLLDRPTLSVPSDVACLGFTMLFICATVINGICCTFVYLFLPLTKVAFHKPFSVVLLYIVQMTLLHRFYPGNGNIPEIIGIVCIILASVVFPFKAIDLCGQKTVFGKE